MTISTEFLVSTVPGVVSGQGQSIQFNGLILTESTSIPIGSIQPFTNLSAVLAYFGSASAEYDMAQYYFKGFNGSTQKPGMLYFFQFNTDNVAAYLRGGTYASTLNAIKAITSGSIAIDIDGTTETVSAINLSSATSFSNAASLITTAAAGAFTCSYDAQLAAFVIESPTTGATSTIDFPATSALCTLLNLPQASGGVLSQGAAIADVATYMTAIDAANRNWVSFSTTFEPDTDIKLEFAQWVNGSENYAYIAWDTEAATALSSDSTSFAYLINGVTTVDANGNTTVVTAPTYDYDNTVVVYDTAAIAAALQGFMASVNLNQPQGWVDYAYLQQSGLASSVSSRTTSEVLESKRVYFLGDFASPTTAYKMGWAGAISGVFDWLNDFLGNRYIRAQLEQAWMDFRSQRKNLPFNDASYSTIVQVFANNVFEPAKTLGAVNAGVALDEIQTIEINTLANVDDAARLVEQNGYYIKVIPATTAQRNARVLDVNSWYTSGGSVSRISISVFLVQ
jgi:hypothetical protein